jgi:hypothetical protein
MSNENIENKFNLINKRTENIFNEITKKIYLYKNLEKKRSKYFNIALLLL